MLLDNRDLLILSQLKANGRLSNGELAERVGMSASACWRRVKQFEETGIITRYGAVLDSAAMGLNFSAIVHVQLTRHDPGAMDAFIQGVVGRREVQSCYATTGQADYHLLVQCNDIDAYNCFLEEFLFQIPAVRSAQTNVVLRQIKAN